MRPDETGARDARPPQPRRPTAPDGLVVVDKPQGWTSHDVVARLRRLASSRKVGHAGTLDPMATGVLVVGIGRATRLLTYVVGADKEYTATIRLGMSTTTDDAEGEPLTTGDVSGVTRDDVEAGVGALTGTIRQVPSTVSAIKVDGRRAYALARAGEQVELAAREVTVSRFDVHDVRYSSVPQVPAAASAPRLPDGARSAASDVTVLDVDVTVVCSSGTYVRALARDLGTALGVGGHLTALRRTRVGGYGIAQARTLDDLEATPFDRPLDVLPLGEAARAAFPVRELTADEARALSYGQSIEASGKATAAGSRDVMAGVTAALAPDGRLVALVEARGGAVRPILVFSPA